MATTAHTSDADAPHRGTGSTGRKIRLAITGLLLLGILVQFYLAGRGVFRASDDFEAHVGLGWTLHTLTLVILVLTVAIKDLRNRVDIGLAVALFVLATIQGLIATYETPELGALHPVNALLMTGAAAGILARDRRLSA